MFAKIETRICIYSFYEYVTSFLFSIIITENYCSRKVITIKYLKLEKVIFVQSQV